MSASATTSSATAVLGTSLARARCPHPAAIERMKRSLSQHGQLTPAVTVVREGKLEILDGFKRHAAAKALGWPELHHRVLDLDETAQWVAMLQLNLSACSITVLEEALGALELPGPPPVAPQVAEGDRP